MKKKSNPELAKHNFYYSGGVDCRYSTRKPCYDMPNDENNPCYDDYCRCGIIEDIRITNVNFDDVVQAICKHYNISTSHLVKDDILNRYGINRIATINRLYIHSSFEGKSCGGYYGEELEGIFLEERVANSVSKNIEDFLLLDDKEKVEFLLELEYHDLISSVKNRKWGVVELSPDDVVIPNAEHEMMVKKSSLYNYNGEIVCVCVQKYNKPYLIDGYHRLSTKMNQDVIQVLLGVKDE